ncbi:MAG: hypothetical protein KUG72_12930 [Pseudomonadales bacterium]|nr:hypothetical protein [Pseudomonadales bacterium]
MPDMMNIITEYTDEKGKSPYADWLRGLRDARAKAKIIMQVDKMEPVLQQRWIDGFSAPVVLRNKAQCAGNGRSPCQALQRGYEIPQERPKGGSVSAHVFVVPLAKDYGHSLRGTPCHER